jgi:histidinol-phosphate aminotransferase
MTKIMLPFIRSDLAQSNAYKPHPSSDTAAGVPVQLDRLDTNESPYDLPSELKEKLAWTYQQVIETNRYPDGGHGTLKDAIAQYVNESASLTSSVFTAANNRHLSGRRRLNFSRQSHFLHVWNFSQNFGNSCGDGGQKSR